MLEGLNEDVKKCMGALFGDYIGEKQEKGVPVSIMADGMQMFNTTIPDDGQMHRFTLSANFMIPERRPDTTSVWTYWNIHRVLNTVRYKLTGKAGSVKSLDHTVPGLWYRMAQGYVDGKKQSQYIEPCMNIKRTMFA
jgi:hypothetical protein